ncbi:VWA domain-containing protein [Occallatibacter riparius]|uniref:VWA domain-containing protein n=1 Tax=Occallatibacter riparius TaxID=1002689 RepID=A0A9J7BXA7_9BACT|nr:VWA domain-containing protein [Occallatibacter riparius]UWZ85590.1 VWA domain-containing protein [Occallatibacter riparius]
MKGPFITPALTLAFGLALVAPAFAQEAPADSGTTLRLNSRAVLVDVIVTDREGKPVHGLSKDSFKLTEQGTAQNISYFEEHRGLTAEKRKNVSMPQLPEDVFSNYSPIATPPAVNILLIDALNTPMGDQMYLRQAAERYLKSLKPGTRLAIVTLSLNLRFVSGFSDDPAVLATALGYHKNDKPEPSVLLQSKEETNAQDLTVGLMNQLVGAGPGAMTPGAAAAMIQSFQQFMAETKYAQTADREYRTTQALQQLAIYLSAFPGRKNLIWMSGAFPLDIFGLTDMRFDDTVPKTVNLLAASRVAVYPVDVRGAWTPTVHTAESSLNRTVQNPQQVIGPPGGFPPGTTDPSSINSGHDDVTTASGLLAHNLQTESSANNSSNATMDMVAEQTGGKAFYNGNDLSGIIDKVTSSSSDFYTLSYTPSDTNMNGALRKISVNVSGGKYSLSYRHGYYAREDSAPGSAQGAQQQAAQRAVQTGDPLAPFMDFGLPLTDQILYTERIVPAAPSTPSETSGKSDKYAVDFVVPLTDLDLKLNQDGNRTGTINLGLIVYDKYGQIVSRREHLVALNIKPDAWEIYQKNGGLQLHADVEVPKGQFWLRTGVYDASTRKVGTMEVPFSSVHPLEASTATTQKP